MGASKSLGVSPRDLPVMRSTYVSGFQGFESCRCSLCVERAIWVECERVKRRKDWPMGAVMLDIHASVALCFKQFDTKGRI